MKTLRHYNKIYLGKNIYNEKIYLDAPSWECGWYWSFGYLGNKNCHYHVDGLKKDGNNNYINLFDGLKKEFRDTFIVKEDGDVWVLAELFETFYTLKKAAGVLGRGGSHMTKNPISELIKNKDEVERINNTVLPAVFDEIYKILDKY